MTTGSDNSPDPIPSDLLASPFGKGDDAVIEATALTKVFPLNESRKQRAAAGRPREDARELQPASGPSGVDQESTPGLVAVNHLDLYVQRGEIFGLLGPNGAGKSTTIGIFTTRVIPTSGSANVAGIDVVAQPAKAKRVIGVVSQTNTLDRSLSVRDNLYYHGRYFAMTRADARQRADELLEQFRLADRASAVVMSLSGGMAQRLMVARAVFHRPEVLFLDEPTAGLDPQSRLALWDLVHELHGGGQTVLLTTHYMEEADQLCERLAIMDHGRVLAMGTPAELKRTLGSSSEINIETTGNVEALAKVLAATLGDSSTGVKVIGGTVRCFVREASGVLASVVSAAEHAGISITNLSITEPTLESVFISLTGRDLRE